LERADKRYEGNLLLGAEHQLRQPLNALSLLIGELREVETQADREAVLEDMRYALELSKAWLDSLVDLEKAEQGLLRRQVQDVPLQPVFGRLKQDFAEHFAGLGLGFRLVPTGAVVRSDPAVLRRLIALLLDNAGKFTREGKVLLGCRRAGGRLRVEVWDTGQGVPENERKRLFEPFYRLENEVRPRDRGLGLGLTYAQRLADLAGAALTLRAHPGRGSCFALSLTPVAPGAADEEPAAHKTAAEDAPLPANPLAGAEVLVLAGAEEAGDLSGRLGAWGARARVVSADALAPALEGSVDLLVADAAVFEAAGGWARLTGTAAPAVILIAAPAPGPDVAKRAEAAGAYLLARPLKPARLRALCHYALSHR
jgi:hypothetical protein